MSLNDPQWGRGKSSDEQNNDNNDGKNDNADRNDQDRDHQDDNRTRSRGQGDDLDRLWEEFNRALGGMLGQPERGRRPQDQKDYTERDEHRDDQGSPRDDRQASRFDDEQNQSHPTQEQIRKQFENIKRMQPKFLKPKSNGKGLAFALVVALGLWGATGFYIVPEGQSGIVTTFGKYTQTTMPGFRWHLPWPVQNADIVDVSSVRTVAIGATGRANREAEALMLTDDENIVDLRFNVQYRIKAGEGAMNYLFRSRYPDESVRQAAESAMREVVGRRKMDSVLFESKQEIAEGVKRIMQDMLDRYHTGIEVMSVAIQNAQPPQPVQAAFNDAVKAGQDRERQINEGEAYANAVIPKAHGMAARLQQEAEGYKTRVVETATGDAERFSQILAQYEKAPQVTRDRMYVDMMQQVFQSTTKVFVDTKDGNNLLYLPFDKLMEQNKTQATVAAAQDEAASSTAMPVAADASQTDASTNVYNQRSLRDRSR